MGTARLLTLPQRGCLPGRVSAWEGVCLGGCLLGGVCLGVSAWGVSAQGVLCPGVCVCPGGVSAQGVLCLSRGVSV